MKEMDLKSARMLAVEAINKLMRTERLGELMIVDSAIIETEEAWYFPYDAAAFVVNGDISAALAGNVPVKVPRVGGALTYEAPARS
ncbi:YrhB domain-containing protein [Mycobacterium persicum]|uniref:YrhB domain-containing protein n=1 Tax=Mycobacterium persicum TaxID=1487726 RepID=UPI0013C34BC3|nr:YrhB domain-containing protein [Mycobacterium persicum]